MLTGMIDAHLHVVDPATSGPDRSGHPDGAWWDAIDASPTAVARRLAEAEVRGGVLVQAFGAHGIDHTAAAAATAELGSDWRFVAAIDGVVDVASHVDSVQAAGAAGLRLFSIPAPETPWLDADRGHEIVARCAARSIVPVVCCLQDELASVAALARAHPDVEFALDHIGFVGIGADETGLAPIAALPNVVLKLSTGVFDHSAFDPAATVRRLLDLVGADRLAWGSDHPQVRDRNYATLAALARDAVDELPDAQRAAVLEGTTARLWF